MSNEKLIDLFKEGIDFGFDIFLEEKEKQMCIEALEKQVGKKPLVDYVRNSYKKYKCPMCKEEVQINYDMSYCLECGQKLDWSEVK